MEEHIHDTLRTIHLVGVAGVGMSALAQVLIAQKHRVTGSDRYCDVGEEIPAVTKLKKAGVEFVPQDGSGITGQTSCVVVSTAIETDNPDLVAAKSKEIPVLHRAEMLAKLAEGKKCIGITGTSGKSTVTGMMGWILEQAGQNPTVVNGAAVLNWANDNQIGNVRLGSSNIWVIELDESDRSLLHFHPDWAVITNSSADHFPMDETVSLFKTFSAQVRQGTVGNIEESTDPAFCPQTDSNGSSFVYKDMTFRIPLIGRHNAENAFHAVQLCERMGLDMKVIRDALESFRGIERRLQFIGTAGGVSVIDDYAHNPAKIRAAWKAVIPYYRRVIGIWRPHGYRPLQMMADQLLDLFDELCWPNNPLYVLPVYYAGGTAARSIDSAMFVNKLRQRSIPAELTPDYKSTVANVREAARPGDVVLCMGARDPHLSDLARQILEQLPT